MLCRDRLPLRGIQELQVGLRDIQRTVARGHIIDHGNWRFGPDADTRNHDLETFAAGFGDRQIDLVFPCDQHVSDAAFGEGRGCPARAAVEHGHVGAKLLHVVEYFCGVALVGLAGIRPCRQVIPAGTTGCLRVCGDHADSRTHKVGPVVDLLWVPGTDKEHDGRRIRRAVDRQPLLPVLRQQLGLVRYRIDIGGINATSHWRRVDPSALSQSRSQRAFAMGLRLSIAMIRLRLRCRFRASMTS
jgi:hypothetical protein